GVSAFVGLRINRSLALEAGWLGTVHSAATRAGDAGDDYMLLNGMTADAKIYLHAGRDHLEPYIQGGVGLYVLDDSDLGTASVGTGFQAGGGLDVRVGPRLSLGVRGLYRGMAMGAPGESASDTFVNAVTVDGNLTLRF
ncbi:MAG: hypothetical protein AAGC55_19285, partial [Myxococcota bacterium]